MRYGPDLMGMMERQDGRYGKGMRCENRRMPIKYVGRMQQLRVWGEGRELHG